MSDDSIGVLMYDIVACKKDIFADNVVFKNECNKAFLAGNLEGEIEFSHESHSEKFFKVTVSVKRLSGTEDFIDVTVRERLANYLKENNAKSGDNVKVCGDLRSSSFYGSDQKKHLKLSLFANSIKLQKPDDLLLCNIIYLKGVIRKIFDYRETPRGRMIMELMLSTPRVYEKKNSSDYIPCIAWEDNMDYMSTLTVGDEVELCGRIQSRVYFKRDAPDSESGFFRRINEVSIVDVQR